MAVKVVGADLRGIDCYGNYHGSLTGSLVDEVIDRSPGSVYVGYDIETLEEARTSAFVAGKTVVVTSSLTEAQSNILAAWPADRALRVEKGGSINPSTAFTGLPYAELQWFGSGKTGFQLAINSLAAGGTMVVPYGTHIIENTAAVSSSTANISIRIDGDIVSTSILANVLEFTGYGVKVSGKGSITGPGTFLDTNSSDPAIQWLPSLIKLAGVNSECTGLTFIDHPTNALWLAGNNGKATGNWFYGDRSLTGQALFKCTYIQGCQV